MVSNQPYHPNLTRITASFACASFLSTVCTLKSSFVPTSETTIGFYAAVLVAQGLINTFGVHHILHHLNTVSIWLHALGTFVVVIVILAKAPTHQSAKFVFQTFIDRTGVDPDVGWGVRASNAYVAVIGVGY